MKFLKILEFVRILLSLFNFKVFLVAEKNSRHGIFGLTHIFGQNGKREGGKAKKKSRDDWNGRTRQAESESENDEN